ncbi:MAG: chloride channel protein [Pseudomonadales bacterium]
MGLFTGTVILLFRASIEVLASALLPAGSESFELLPYAQRFGLPVLGALLLGAVLNRLPPTERRVGVPHVMERLSRHQGNLPARNALVQFFGGIVALVAGVSGGREGPAVHLGSASASLMGQALNLPNNSVRVLVACGAAAAIAGSFNTPLAGVIFAMEVVMMEYTLGSFIPVIVASVTATVMSRYFFGDEPAFLIAPQQMRSLAELPFIAVSGLVVGCVATAFNMAVQAFTRLRAWPYWIRALLAGLMTALAALSTPAVMGVGYDTVSATMLGEIALTSLVLIVLLKSVTSAAAVGLGLPVGLIGPTFVIGAALGGILGYIGDYLQPAAGISIGLYVMLGMTAMMGAVLQAPLAALVAVLELTANPSVLLPAMLVIVVASLTSSVIFRQKSVFLSTLDILGLKYPPDPITRHLQRAGVASIMNRDLVRLAQSAPEAEVRSAMAAKPMWVVVESEPGQIRCVLRGSDLQVHLDGLAGASAATGTQGDAAAAEGARDAEIDLMQIPGERLDVANLDYRASLAEAQAVLKERETEALCIRRARAPLIESVLGVVTQQDIDNYRDRGA